ncbi:amino acid ABC transporter substrate-binding protein [Atopobiaceae bacterium Sow4_H2]
MATTYSRRDFLKIGAVAAGSMFTLGLVGCGGSGDGAATGTASGSYTLVKDGELTVAVNYGYIPMEWLDDDKKPKGFEIELVEKIADELGLKANFMPDQKFDTIVPMIKQGGKADIAIASFSITEERQKEIDFTDAYMDSNQGIVVRAENKDQYDGKYDKLNVEGVKVAAQAGTTGEDWIKENLPKATLVTLDGNIECLTGVESKLYDAAVEDLPVMEYMCKNSYTDLAVAVEIPTGEQYGIVVSKDNAELTKKINKILERMQDDSSMDDLKQKWFGTTDL